MPKNAPDLFLEHFRDFAMIADATGEVIDGVLTLRIDLRPPDART